MKNLMNFISGIGLTGFLDILLMSVVIYALLIWFKKSKAAFVLIGIFIVGLIYLIARQFNLLLTAAIFQGFFAVILLAVIIIFQEDLKHLFEQVAVWSLTRRIKKKQIIHLARREVETLTRTLNDFADDRIGALVVIQGRDIIDRHLDGGTELEGYLSEPLLKSIFDPHSIGHDGALIIEKDRVVKFSCHLPLSKDIKKIGRSGTRHAAALGLSEVTDALCLVVSEEQGIISVAYKGELESITDAERLTLTLEKFYADVYPAARQSPWTEIFKRNIKEKFIALSVTMALWFIFVHESQITFQKYAVQVDYTNLPSHLEVQQIIPPEVMVTYSGKRSDFYFASSKRMRIYLNMLDMTEGKFVKSIQSSDIIHPKDLTVESITPQKVKIGLKNNSAPPVKAGK